MATFDEIVRICRIEKVELTTWIEQSWVRPQQTPEGPQFDEVDEARIALIRDLRDLMVNDEAMPVVLSLLDQVYAARRLLRCVDAAVTRLPEPLRQQVRAQLRLTSAEGEPSASD